MWKNFVKDYLNFSKKDRVGVIVLVTLIFIVVLLPYIWPAKKNKQADKQEIEKIKLLSTQLNKTNDASSTAAETKEPEYKSNNYAAKNYPVKSINFFVSIPIH